VEHSIALDILGGRCATYGAAGVLTALLDRLREMPDAVAAALGGDALRVRLSISSPRVVEAWVMFSSDGHVAMVSEGAFSTRRFAPELVVQGSGRSIMSTILGLGAADALVLIPLVPTERFERLLPLIAEELVKLAADA
jgi:hypothetical protein